MELREAEALCVLDHHQGCIGNVDAHLDDGGGDENLGEARDEVLHDGILLGSGHRTVHEADGEVGQALLKVVAADGRGCEVELVAFLDERTDPVDLAALRNDAPHDGKHVVLAGGLHGLGDDGRAAGRQLVDDRDVEVREVAHGERARNRGRGEHQEVRDEGGLWAGAQRKSLGNAEAVLLVDDRKPEVREFDAFLNEGVGADDDACFA